MRAFAVCLMVPPFEKVTKRRQKKNLFQFYFTLHKYFVFVLCRHFMTLKWLKVLKLNKICLKMVKAMAPKTTNQNILFLSDRIPFNLHCKFNECGIKLLILINNYLLINLVSTWHLISWYAKHECLWMIPVRKLDRTCIYRAQLCTSLA